MTISVVASDIIIVQKCSYFLCYIPENLLPEGSATRQNGLDPEKDGAEPIHKKNKVKLIWPRN